MAVQHQAVGHNRHGDVARTKARVTGDTVRSQSPSMTLMTATVGKTQNQIIRAELMLYLLVQASLCTGGIPAT